jgi:phenylacetate-CoA ligase
MVLCPTVRTSAAELYVHVPVWAQNVLCSVEGLRLRWQRFPPGFAALLAETEARMQWRADQLAAHRLVRVRAMLVHAGRHVPFWRETFAAVGFAPERLQHVDELEALPVLTKDTIVREGERMRAERLPHGALRDPIDAQTSGTTGGGLRFRMSLEALREQWAVCWRYRRWHGLLEGTWCGQLGGRLIVPVAEQSPPFHRINWAGRQVLLSSFHLGPVTAEHYLRELVARDVPWIHGYTSMVAVLADAAADLGMRMPALRWVTIASESLSATQRDRIVRGFGIGPRQHYAQTESIANFSECPLGRLHVDEDHACVEFVPHVRDADGRMLYRVLGTSVTNWWQPFIRYDVGDLVALAEDSSCACGRPGRLVQEIDGRREDLVELASGAKVGRLNHVFNALEFLRESQIRQSRPGAIAIHVVPRGEWTEAHERRLLAEAHARLGPDMQVSIALESQLPRSAAGKLRLVVRED